MMRLEPETSKVRGIRHAPGVLLSKGLAQTSPRSSAGAFPALLPRFPSHFRAGGLLCHSAWMFGQTRSVSGDTEAARHRLPRTRRFIACSYAWAQAGFPTFPAGGVPPLGTRGKKLWWIQIGGQIRQGTAVHPRDESRGLS